MDHSWGLELVFGTAPSWAERLTLLGAQVIFTLLNYVGQRLWAFKNNKKASGQLLEAF